MKRFALLICLILLTNFLYSQIYSGFEAGYVLPSNSTNEIDFGIGGNLLMGYSFNKNLDFGLTLGKTWFKSIADKYQAKCIRANVNYYFLKKSISPYLGLSSGLFVNGFKDPLGLEHYENGVGIVPSIGVSFYSFNTSKFRILTEISYNKIFTEHQLDYFSFSIGMVYNFHFNQ